MISIFIKMISSYSGVLLYIKLCGILSKVYDRCWILLHRRPHDLHLVEILSESKMNLFMSRLIINLNMLKINKLLEFYDSIFIEIKCIKGRVKNMKREVMIRLNKFKIIKKLFPCDLIIFIVVISQLKEFFQIRIWNFALWMCT